MLMAEHSVPIDDDFLTGEFVDAVEEELCIDMGTLMDILEEKEPDRVQSSLEDVLLKHSLREESAPEAENHDKLQLQSGYRDDFMDPVRSYPSYDLETSDARIGGSGDYYTQLEPTDKMCSPVQTCSASLNDWFPPTSGTCPDRVGKSQFETPGCSTASSFSEGDGNLFLYPRENMGFQADKAGIQSRLVGSQIDSKFVDASHSPSMENLDVEYGALRENRLGSLGRPENKTFRSLDVPFTDADVASHNVASTDSTICHSSDVITDVDDPFSAMHYYMNTVNEFIEDCSGFHFQYLPNNEQITTNTKDQVEVPTESACSSSRMVLNAQGGTNNRSVSESPMIDYFDVNGQSFRREDDNNVAPIYGNSLSNIDIQLLGYFHSNFSSKNQLDYVKDEGSDELITSRSMMNCSVDLDEAVSWHSSYQNSSDYFPYEDENQWFTGVSSSLSDQEHLPHAKEETDGMIIESKRDQQEIFDGTSAGSPFDRGNLNLCLNTSDQHFPCSQDSVSSKKQLAFFKEEKGVELIKPRSLGSHVPKVSPESIQSNSSDCKSLVDDDPDICILEDISQPPRSNQSLVLGKSFATSQPAYSNNSHVFVDPGVPLHHSSCSGTLNYTGSSYPGGGAMRSDERLIFEVALQDLSQPKSEASLPDGVLAVPLLRHQRIALSWMVQKETYSSHCSGGILADDQGLGKTISTIALILKERPPTFTGVNASKCKLETLNLDDEDDNNNGVCDLDGIKQESDYSQVTSNGSSVRSLNSVEHARGRPAAGTLVVCPTSVLRQWEEELHNKVTSKGNLSVLVYHGSNRTRDPHELAKYDVVITTYSIVSMEVPKQPLVDKEDDDEKIRVGIGDVPPMSFSGKKRKYPPSSDKKGLKHKKGGDGMLLEIASGPLAKVRWFRVVLDEAQSIKNHRTQVARACWGLRAKRRWCLSGTPIQNAIDDLYSYFRFLRYEPFAVYKTFCTTIKVPITKNPVKGYRKLQAVLKTIMLRRTKGTLLDGEPIINLPPKVIELKQVDFTKEERDFYNQLEIDSRDQFKEYAAAGTVKQNYVNILLMLLRLRQACDHPLLVKGFDSNPFLRSSVEMAKKLPQEKQVYLLNCFEGSSAICGICNDAPEDAVVSVCGHIFCNQCICEHLTGDDIRCPATNCKVRLNMSSVFSKATLDNCLAEQSGKDYSAGSVSDFVEALEPCSDGLCYNSSKIKAALEVLQSLTTSREPSSVNSSLQNSSDGSTCCPEDSYDHAKDSPNNVSDGKKLVAEKCLNDVMKVGGEKAIVFSQWTKMLDLLEASLKASSIQYRRLDGTMSVAARDRAVKDFNNLPEVSVMIMSLKAASLGLNMVAACRVLLLDLWWNPTTEDQAIDRAHRIGQTRPVTVLRLTVKNTVEDRILALQQKKREMVASAFGEDETGGQQTRLTVEDLNYLFMV